MRRANVRPCRRRDTHGRRRVPSALAFVAALTACIALREGWRLGDLRGAATLLEAEAEIAAARAAAAEGRNGQRFRLQRGDGRMQRRKLLGNVRRINCLL